MKPGALPLEPRQRGAAPLDANYELKIVVCETSVFHQWGFQRSGAPWGNFHTFLRFTKHPQEALLLGDVSYTSLYVFIIPFCIVFLIAPARSAESGIPKGHCPFGGVPRGGAPWRYSLHAYLFTNISSTATFGFRYLRLSFVRSPYWIACTGHQLMQATQCSQ